MIIFYHRISHSSTKHYCNCSAVCYVYIYTHTYVYMYTSYGFSSIHVYMWELDYKESWAPKNWWFQTVVLEKNLESPLESKEINLVNAKGNQPWIFIGVASEGHGSLVCWNPWDHKGLDMT